MYEPGSPRPEPVEVAPEDPRPGPSGKREPSREDPGAPNIFTDSARGREEECSRASNDFNDTDKPRVRGRVEVSLEPLFNVLPHSLEEMETDGTF